MTKNLEIVIISESNGYVFEVIENMGQENEQVLHANGWFATKREAKAVAQNWIEKNAK